MTFKFSKQTFDGYVVHEPISDLFVVEEFLTLNEQKILTDFINSLTQKDWEFTYYEGLKKFCIEKFGTDDVEQLVADGKFEVTENWKDKNVSLRKTYKTELLGKVLMERLLSLINYSLDVKGPGIVQRQQPGVSLKSHFDQHTDPSIQYAAIIYVNDDYTDGELFFPKKDFKIKPKERSLLIFPGTEEFEHGVHEVGEGPIRHVLPTFISIKDFYLNNKY